MEWVLTAWSLLYTDLIDKSFKSYALNLTVDGSKDSEILCFKKGKLRKAGAEAQLSILNEPNLLTPFQVITDSCINEANDDKTTTLNKDSDIDIEI